MTCLEFKYTFVTVKRWRTTKLSKNADMPARDGTLDCVLILFILFLLNPSIDLFTAARSYALQPTPWWRWCKGVCAGWKMGLLEDSLSPILTNLPLKKKKIWHLEARWGTKNRTRFKIGYSRQKKTERTFRHNAGYAQEQKRKKQRSGRDRIT